jgi:ATP-dependent Clp protease protease subunit
MTPTPKRKEQKITKLPFEIDIHQLLLHSRQLSLTGPVTEKTIQPLIDQIMTLQIISDAPISLWINSGGGFLTDGFALIDTMRMSRVPIYTIVRGYAASMAGLISVAGHRRFITENSQWMAHDIAAGGYDYGTKLFARIDEIKLSQKKVFDFLAANTKMTPVDLEKARHEELWLNPQQCLQKGIVDGQITLERKS